MKILIINGPNLNMLGKRNKAIYGSKTLDEINSILHDEASGLKVDLLQFQSNSEGNIIDFIQKEASSAAGIIINAGALTHYGLALRDALIDSAIPIIEVHISNIYSREEWRAKSIIAPIVRGQISGLGWRGYILALQAMVGDLHKKD